MKIVHFVENYGRLSETFISNTIIEFSKNNVYGYIITNGHVKGTNPPDNFKIIEKKYATKYSFLLRYLYAIFKIFNKNYHSIITIRQLIANNLIKPQITNKNIEHAYIDFGPNAILVYKTLIALKIPYTVHFHGYDASQMLGEKWYADEIYKVFINSVNIIVPSNHLRRRLILAGCPSNKLHTLYNGVQLNSVQPVDISIKLNNKPTLIFVGRFVEKKNPEAVLYTFKLIKDKISNARLIMVGDGPLLNKCINIAKQLNINESVKFLGALNNSDVFKELNKSWIYLQNSTTAHNGDQEGFPVSIVEACAHGLPVISTIHSGIPEIIQENISGYLVQEHDFESMAEKAIKLLNNKKKMIEISLKNIELVKSKYNLRNKSIKIIDLMNIKKYD